MSVLGFNWLLPTYPPACMRTGQAELAAVLLRCPSQATRAGEPSLHPRKTTDAGSRWWTWKCRHPEAVKTSLCQTVHAAVSTLR